MSADQNYDVAIVGFGPVGAFAALLLAEAGLRVAILERSSEIYELPRAVGLDSESVRAFQRIGRGENAESLTQPPREGERIIFANSKHEPLFGQEVPPRGPNGWRDIAFFDQPELEGYLREELSKCDGVDVQLDREVTAVYQSDDEVVVDYRDVSGPADFSLRASFVVGCDGASSMVRREIDSKWHSLGYDQDWLVIDIVINSEADLPLDIMQVCDPARLTTYICGRDPNRRWEFALQPGETRGQMLEPATIDRLLAPWLPKEHYTLRRAAVYQFHAAIAEVWRKGRVLLAGDAAHQTPPFLGQGLNAGFRDAVNLAWKLPLVLAGTCDQSLLDSYPAERDPHSRRVVEKAVEVGKLMETIAAREAGLPDPYPQPDGEGEDSDIRLPRVRGGVLVTEQLDKIGAVGRLLSQPLVKRPGEEPRRFDEWVGRSFALVARSNDDLAVSAEAAAVLDRIDARKVSLEGFELVDSKWDSVFDESPAVVLRPDRIVFGAVDADRSLSHLVLELGERLGLKNA